MSRYQVDREPRPILEAARLWAQNCLLGDMSVFSPSEPLWTPDHLDELDHVFTQNLDDGAGTFFEKLDRQTSLASPPARKLMAEALWILMLFQSNITVETKRTNVRTVWGWSGEELNPNLAALSDTVLSGLGSTGTAYNTQRWRELGFLLTLSRRFKDKSADDRQVLLSDPWGFAAWLRSYPEARHRQLCHIIPHLLFPDEFERISSGADKRAVLAAFIGERGKDLKQWEPEKVDRALLDVRKRLETDRGGPIDFYQPELAERWRGSANSWLLSWNPENWQWQTLAADRAATAKGQTVIMSWSCASTKPKEGDAAFLMKTGTPPRGIVAVGTIVKGPFENTHYDAAKAAAGEVANFVEVGFTAVRDAARDTIVDREALVERHPTQVWSPQASGISVDTAAARTVANLWKALPALEGEINGDVSDDTVASVPARNIILYGPPGTGKTHALQSIHMPRYESSVEGGGVDKRYEFITFHQSYSYEDFIEGIRPVPGTQGGLTYEVRPGVFKRICERAKADPQHRYAIFIDEINRGNVAKVLGELITLLEPNKRAIYGRDGRLILGLETTLPYSGERFGVPANLDVIGTMNTADRSIALLDAALRRRFEFDELMPAPGVITGADGSGIISDDQGDQINLRQLLVTMNRRIVHLAHRDQTLGHACFVRVRDFPTLRRVLAREVVPFLQELFYDDWRRIRLVFADQAAPPEHQLVRAETVAAADLFPNADKDVNEGIHYSLTPEVEITPDAVRKIYEPLA
jgi:5-methylcytosine-specific restriction protein B